MPLGGKDRYLPSAVRLTVVLAHQCFMRGKLALDLRAVVSRCAIKLLLRVGQLAGIKPELRLCNFKIVISLSWLRGSFCWTGLGLRCWGQSLYLSLIHISA